MVFPLPNLNMNNGRRCKSLTGSALWMWYIRYRYAEYKSNVECFVIEPYCVSDFRNLNTSYYGAFRKIETFNGRQDYLILSRPRWQEQMTMSDLIYGKMLVLYTVSKVYTIYQFIVTSSDNLEQIYWKSFTSIEVQYKFRY